jgi:hypothetical protein
VSIATMSEPETVDEAGDATPESEAPEGETE